MKAFFVFTVLMALVAAVFCRPQESVAASKGPNALDGMKKLFEGIGVALGTPGRVLSGGSASSSVLRAISAISEGVEEIAAAGRGAKSN